METKTLINLNTAEESELAQVPGIGPALAQRIVAARPFDSLDDVRRVPGIGTSTVDRIAPYATITETLPVEASEDTLGFVDIPSEEDSREDEEAQPAAEVPADLIPLPPLPVVPPWDEDEAEVVSEEAESETPEEVQAVVPPPLPEMPSETAAEAKSPTLGVELEPEEPQAEDLASTKVPPKPVTRAQLGWVSFGVFVVTLLVTLALGLGILAGINGGLTYASPSEVARVSREVTALRGEAETLGQSLDSVQTRLDSLEGLSGRIEALETARGDLQREVEALTTQAVGLDTRIQDLEQATTTLNTQMERVQAQSERVQEVMSGLRDLLNGLFPEE